MCSTRKEKQGNWNTSTNTKDTRKDTTISEEGAWMDSAN